MIHKLAIVIPTIGRPNELKRMLASLERQSWIPDQVIIVEQGERLVERIGEEFPKLKIDYIHFNPPSAGKARNIGVKTVSPGIDLISFMEDDIMLEPNAIEAMLRFWETASEEIGGAGFNLMNSSPMLASWLKRLPLTSWLGLYSREKGVVTRSGFHTMILLCHETTYVHWLFTGASVWRRRILEEFSFDEWFSDYSYLEDLDFSYRIGKKYKLVVVADACFYHYPSPRSRPDHYLFGRKEVTNRIYFVKKHRLSLSLCYLALFIRMLLSMTLGIYERDISYFKRAWGNWVAMFYAIVKHDKGIREGKSFHK